MPEVRKGMPDVQLTREEFVRRFRERFADPGFEPLTDALDRIADAAWDAYDNSRKAPHTRKAGPGYADPDYDLSVDWIEASRKIEEAEQRQKDPASPSRILLINGAARSEHTCPGEMSKTFRLATIAREIFDSESGHRNRISRPEPADVRIRPQHLPLQDLRLDRDAALPLAVLLLPEPRARPGAGLDERHLSDVGGGARRHDPLPGELVSDAERAQADDRPPGLRRRRQSRSDVDARQDRRRSRRRSNSRAGTTRAIWRAAYSRWWCMATPSAPKPCKTP